MAQPTESTVLDALQKVKSPHGSGSVVAEGMIQDQIAETAARRGDDIAHGRQDLTGVSAFPYLAETAIEAEPHPQVGLPLKAQN